MNLPDRNGRTPLIAALRHLVIVARLLDAGADVNVRTKAGDTALSRAAASGNVEVAKMLLARGASVAGVDDLGRSPLVVTKNVQIVEALLSAGASVDTQDARGRTALMYAATRGDVAIAKLLLGAEANVALRDAEGKTAADLAARGFLPAHAEISAMLRGPAPPRKQHGRVARATLRPSSSSPVQEQGEDSTE